MVLTFIGLDVVLAGSPAADLDRATRLYNQTNYTQAVKVLESVPQKDGAVYDLLGRSHFMQAEFKKASEAFEKAVAADPHNSRYFNWLGKAYGRRAETASFITAPGLASKARQNFEKAVELDPKNKEAVGDLFEYYLQAPGFLGGGLDKAEELAKRIQQFDRVEYQWAQAKLAEKRKEFQTAEQHLRRAVELAPNQAGRVIDLAKFLAKQGRHQESEAAFRQAEKIAPTSPKLMFERANTYIEANRNLETARRLLRQYLASRNLTPDDPPREEAAKLLRQAEGG